MKISLLAAALATAFSTAALADGFQAVTSRAEFIALIEGRDLTRLGIRLTVTQDGQIAGRAFGTPVTGAWSWSDGYFCRDLFWGEDDLGGRNCQMVEVRGNTMRFTSDRGAGQFADLRLR